MLIKLFFCVFVACQVTDADPIAQYRQPAIDEWEKTIAALEQLDKTEVDPDHAVLFIGSSSIRLWKEMAEDMKPWPAIRRGYGGAKFSDLAVFVDRLVNPHKFDALAIFVGNDISGKKADKDPEEVLRLYQYVVQQVRKKYPKQPVFFIAITPTSSRFAAWNEIDQVNQLVKTFSEGEENLYFIETAPSFLGENGQPRDELFRPDRLHLNRDGYQIWAKLIKEQLESALGNKT